MGVTKTVVSNGNGVRPQRGQTITVHCTGYLKAGMNKFWSTQDAGQSAFSFQVGLGKVIRGWDEGFLSMSQGEKARLEMTGDYAYGAGGFPAWGIGSNATLIFDVEILSIQ